MYNRSVQDMVGLKARFYLDWWRFVHVRHHRGIHCIT